MKLSKKFRHKNLDGMFTLLIYGRTITKYISKFMQDSLINFLIVNLTKIDFCNRSRKLNLLTKTDS